MSIGHYDIIYTDLDGTLLEDKHRHYKCYCDIVDKYGGIPISIDEYWEDKRNKVSRDILLKKTNFTATYEDFFEEWIERIEQPQYLKEETPKPRLLEVLTFLKEHSDKLILVSMRKSRKCLIDELQNIGIIDFFDDIVVGSVLNGQKKSELVTKREGEQCLVIGDTEDDQKLAEKLACDYIAVTNGLRNEKFLNAAIKVQELCDLL